MVELIQKTAVLKCASIKRSTTEQISFVFLSYDDDCDDGGNGRSAGCDGRGNDDDKKKRLTRMLTVVRRRGWAGCDGRGNDDKDYSDND